MSDMFDDVRVTDEELAEGQETTASVNQEDTATEQDTAYVCDRQRDLPDPDSEPRVGIAPSTSDETNDKTLHVYVGNEWNDTFQPVETLVSGLLDKHDTKNIQHTLAEFVIADVTAPSEVDPRETVTIEVGLNNTGVNEYTKAVRLLQDREPIDAVESTVGSGDTEWFDLTWTAPSTGGSYSFLIETEDDTESVTIDVKEPTPKFSFDTCSIRPEDPVEGQTVTFEQIVENTGEKATANIELHVLGSDTGIADTQSVVVDSDSTESVTLEWESETGDSGLRDDSAAAAEDILYQLRIAHNSTRHDAASGQFALQPYDESLSVGEPTVSSSKILPDNTVTVETTIENTGTVDQTTDVTLSVGDTDVATEQHVELAPDEATTVSHEWTPADGGQQLLTVSADEYDNSTTVDVFDGPARFEASSTSISPNPVAPNQEITVDVDVTNTGGKGDSRTIELKRSGEVYDEKKDIFLDPDASTSLSLTGTAPETTGEKWFYVNTQDELQQATVDVEETEQFKLTNLRVTPSEVTQGEIVAVDAAIENTGNVEMTPRIELKANGNPVDLAEPTIRSRETIEVMLRWDSTNYHGEVELTVSTDGVRESNIVDIKKPAEPELTSFSAPTEVTRGETVAIDTTVANVGEAGATLDLAVTVDGSQVDSVETTVDGGDTREVSFSWDTSDYDESVELAVSADDLSESTTVEINESAAFEFASLSAPTEVVQGETVTVDTTVENVGDLEGTSTVEFTVDGTPVDSTEPTLDGGETIDLEFSWDSAEYDGAVELAVSADRAAESTTIEVKKPAAFELTDLSTPTEVTRGDTVAVDTTAENVGDIEGTPTVELTADGDQIDSADPTIDGRDTSEISFSWDSAEYADEASLTVSADESSESTTVEINEPAAFELTSLDAPTEATQGDTVTVDATVENVGDLDGTPTVELTADGDQVGSTELPVDGRDTSETSFSWDSAEYSGEVELTVSADDASESTAVEINEPAAFELTSLDAPTEATQGDTVTVDATVENVGDLEGTPTVELTADGDRIDSTELPVDGRDTSEVSFSWDSVEYSGEIELTVSADDASESTTVEINEPAAFELTSLDAPTEATQGDTVTVDAAVENVGDLEGTPTVELTADGDQVGSTELTVDGGETGELDFSWDSAKYSGAIELTVSVDESSESTTVEINEPAAFEVTDLTSFREPGSAKTVAVDATVENVGDLDGTPTVEFTADGDQVDSTELPIDGGETVETNLSWDSSDSDGETTLAVSAGEASESTTVDLEKLPDAAAFELTSFSVPSDVIHGEPIAVDATVENVGDLEGTPSVTLDADSSQLYSVEPTIDGGDTREISFTVESTEYDGSVELTVSADDVSESATVEIKQPAAFELTSFSAPSEVTQGDTVVVDAAVENVGDIEGTPAVTLAVDGTQADSAEPTVDGGETIDLEFSWDSSEHCGAIGVAVSTDTASESATVTVNEPAAFELTDLSAPTEVPRGETVTVDTTVENVGDLDGTPTVELAADGDHVDSTELSVGGGETGEGSLSWESTDTDGSVELTVSVDESSESATVSVKEPAAFDITSLDAPTEIPRGETVAVETTVENVGDLEGSSTVELAADGQQVDSAELTVDGGETGESSLSWESADTDGPVELTVSVDESSESTTVELKQPASLVLADLRAPTEVIQGEAVVVETTVENVGDFESTSPLEFSANGEQVYATEPAVPGGESREISFSWDSTGHSGPAELVVSADDDSESILVTVNQPAAFEVKSINTPTEITPDDTVTVTTLVENVGDIEATPLAALSVDGSQVDSTELTVDGGETREVGFGWDTPEHGGVVELTVSVADASKSATASVKEPAAFDITSLDAPTEVPQGETVAVETTVENIGDLEGSSTVELAADGQQVDSAELTVDGGETGESRLSWESADTDGSVELTVSVDDSSESATVDLREPAAIALTSLSVPIDPPQRGANIGTNTNPDGLSALPEVSQGETIPVTATVTNAGDLNGTPTLVLTANGSQIDSAEPTVAGGERKEVNFRWNSSGYSGTVELTASADGVNESTTVNVKKTVDPAAFEFTDLTAPAEVEAGETVSVYATVKNIGDVEARPTVELTADGTPVDTREPTLDGGETREVMFSWDSSNFGGGVDLTVLTDGATKLTTTEVREPFRLAGFEIVNLETPQEATQGETVSVDATIKNTGDVADTADLELVVDGTQVTSAEPTIDGKETREISLNWGTSRYSGLCELTVSTDKSSESTTVDIHEPLELAAFEIVSLSAPQEVTQGETVAVDVAVKNTGDVEGTPTVELTADGNHVDTREPTINGRETKEISFSWDCSDQMWAVELAVSVNGATESTTVDVEESLQPAVFDIQNVSAPPADPETGEPVTISANIQNSGGVDGTQEITLQHNGSTVDSTGDVTIEAWETEYVQLTWAGTDTVGSETLTVVTDDDSQSTTVDVGVEEAPEFSLGSRVKTTTLAAEGETVSFDQTIKNAGSMGTAVVEMIVTTARATEQVADVKTVDMEKGDRTSVTLEWDSEVGDGRPALDDPENEEYSDPVYRVSVYHDQREESNLHDSEDDTVILRQAQTDQ